METGSRSLSGEDYYLKGRVAGPGDKNLHGYDTYDDLLAASNRPATMPSIAETQSESNEKDSERMDTLSDLNEIAQTRKLTPDENKTLLKVLEDGNDREKMTASWAIETSGSPEAVKELLEWENEYIRRQLGYDDRDDEDIIPPRPVPPKENKKKKQRLTKSARRHKKR